MTMSFEISDEQLAQINDHFTHLYDYNHWFFRVKTLDIILDNPEKFIKECGDEELKKENIEDYKLSLKTELYYTFFHMTEALFSLMICARTSKLPWLSMKLIKFKEICDNIRDTILQDKLTDEDIRFLFFNGVINKEAERKDVKDSIRFIKEYLKRMGKLFLDSKMYMEYKHGLRLITSNSFFNLIPETGNNRKSILSRKGTAHTYLDYELIRKKGKDEKYKVELVTQSFDYKLYLRLAIINLQLIKNLFETRRQKLKSKLGGKMLVGMFDKHDLNEIFKENYAEKFTFRIGRVHSKPVVDKN